MSEDRKSNGRNGPALEPLSVRIAEAVRLTGLSRSRVYELLHAREIEHIKVGSSTLIPYDSLRAFIERRRAGYLRAAPQALGSDRCSPR